MSLPTPMSPAQAGIYADLQVTMIQAEITTDFLNEYGSTREPTAGMKFLWIQVGLMNTSPEEQALPAPEHFIVLHGETEFKPVYGHRQEHVDYLALTTGLAEGQELDAWLRFDIPVDLELQDLIFGFLPESTQISVGFSSSDYSWADNPIYLWMCAP